MNIDVVAACIYHVDMQHDNVFDFPELTRVDSPQGRYYVSPTGAHMPSVTTILSATKSLHDQQALDNWIAWTGKDRAHVIKTQAADLGSCLHALIERHLLGQDMRYGSNGIHVMARSMFETLRDQGLAKIPTVLGIERMLYVDGLYAGTCDMIAQDEHGMFIVDYKNSRKIKSEQQLSDYYCQLAAYATAMNHMHGTSIDRGRILMVVRPDAAGQCKYAEFNLEGDKFHAAAALWLQRVQQFYAGK